MSYSYGQRRRPCALLFIVLQLCRWHASFSFVPMPSPLFSGHFSEYGSLETRLTRLHYKSIVNGYEESSSPSNGTSTASRNGLAKDCDSEKVNGFEEKGTPNLARDVVEEPSWTRNVYGYAKEAAGTLGDIMSSGPDDGSTPTATGSLSEAVAQRDGLITSTLQSGTLASRFGIEHPLDRMALTANGNLQRLVSSYYDAPVQVLVDYCCPILEDDNAPTTLSTINTPNAEPHPKKWDRLVHLKVHNQTFCSAHSIITVFDPVCQGLVESGQVGLGQLFRYLDILPEFELHDAGAYPTESGGGFWREYTLRCAELSCDIHEDFQSGIWDLHPKQ